MLSKKLNPIDLKTIKVHDPFWGKYTTLVTKEIIPYQWKALNDDVEDAEPSHCISNFEIAAGLRDGEFQGWVFQDTDLAKWLEAVAYSLSYEPNPDLEKRADKAIDLIGKAQEENGYLNTHFSILYPGQQFCNLKEGHELYTSGHMIEAAVAYYKVTGKDKFLNIVRKNADLICQVFNTERYKNAIPGHEEIELALMKLYDVTGDKKYADMAKAFVDRRGTRPNYLSEESKKDWFIDVWHDPNPYVEAYGQSHMPVREQKTAEGHAVRAVYLYSAMADLAYEYDDKNLLEACDNLYQNIINKRMYITGGIGSSGMMERFTTDYDLPNDSNYSESCASIGLAMFCRRMTQITGDASYLDTMELALVNTVLAGIAMDGKSFFYVNPLEVWPDNCMEATSMAHVKATRQKWFGCACCPPNIARTLASLGEYICMTDDEGFFLNLHAGTEFCCDMKSGRVAVRVETEFPWKGQTRICIDAISDAETICENNETLAEKNATMQARMQTTSENLAMENIQPNEQKTKASAHDNNENCMAEGKVRVRVPAYAQNLRVTMNGQKVTAVIEKGYLTIEGKFSKDVIDISFDMPAQVVYANPNVRADVGKVAVVKGPIVYCLEEKDNGSNLSNLYLDVSEPLREEYREDVLGGVTIIKAKGRRIETAAWNDGRLYAPRPVSFKAAELTFVPYCNWGNRGYGEMSVWVRSI